mmetsp:Transcript_96254/g.244574  ORF Transcript_96254/g.244574 Transcript_96254/m.244574 type:complete len:240 (+) Transcript_96254:119-838(+)
MLFERGRGRALATWLVQRATEGGRRRLTVRPRHRGSAAADLLPLLQASGTDVRAIHRLSKWARQARAARRSSDRPGARHDDKVCRRAALARGGPAPGESQSADGGEVAGRVGAARMRPGEGRDGQCGMARQQGSAGRQVPCEEPRTRGSQGTILGRRIKVIQAPLLLAARAREHHEQGPLDVYQVDGPAVGVPRALACEAHGRLRQQSHDQRRGRGRAEVLGPKRGTAAQRRRGGDEGP